MALDDADWCDRESVAALQYVARRLQSERIWILATMRQRSAGAALRPVDLLGSEPRTRRMSLGPLPPPAVRGLIQHYFDEIPDEVFVEACGEVTGGNPFLVVALLAGFPRTDAASGANWAELAGHARSASAPAVANVVLGRLAALPVAATELLHAVAILDARADAAMAARLAGIDAIAAGPLVEALTEVGVLEPGPPLRFPHRLVRTSVYGDIPAATRSRLHAEAARLLTVGAAPIREVAAHLLATDPSEDGAVADTLQAAGRAAYASREVALARRCLSRALREPPAPERTAGVLLDLATVEMDVESTDAAGRFRHALELGGADPVVVARTWNRLAGHLPEMSLDHRTTELVATAIAGLDAGQRELRIESEVALALVGRTDPNAKVAATPLAEPAAVHPDGPLTRGERLARAFDVLEQMHDPARTTAGQVIERAGLDLDAAALVSDDATAVRVQARLITALLGAGGMDAAEDMVRRGQSVARARGRLLADATTSTLLAMCRLWAGALTDAEAECRTALTVMAGQSWADPIPALTLLTEALVAQGRLTEAADIQAGADGHRARQGLVGALALECRARLSVALGQTRSGLDAFVLAGREADRWGIVNPALTSWRAETAPVLASLGMGDQSRTLAAANLDMARAFGSPRPLGLALRAAGLVAEPALREDLLAQSVSVLERSPARYDLARSLVDLGGTLRRRGDLGQARDVLRRGAHVASVCRAVEVVAAAQRELRAAGGRPRRLAVTGVDALTPAESRVARLAGAGQTNVAIAKELGVTAKTIERHLARAYQKLQIHARSELAAPPSPPRDRGRTRRTTRIRRSGTIAPASCRLQVTGTVRERYKPLLGRRTA